MKIFSVILLFVGFVLLFYNDNAFGQTTDNILTVVFIDLGKEGDSTLVIFPNDNTLLIDAGLKFDESFEKVKSVLEENNVQRINLMIATHADADHIGGLARLLADDSPYYNKVDEIWTNGLPHTSDIYNEFIDNIANQDNIQHQIVVAPMSTNLGDPLLVQLVSPPEERISSHSDHATEQNSNSLVTRIIYGDISFLFTADTTWTTEEWLVENRSDLIDVDIMNAPHHGTRYASGYRET
ncbi:MAG: ComEC/Rec2 family competence protein, partial [Nitrosopumilaceae archaeon]